MRCFPAAAFLIGLMAAAARGQRAVELANLHEDISGLNQRLADLAARVEVLENKAAAQSTARPAREAVTPAQLNEAVAALTAQIAELRAALARPAGGRSPAPDNAEPEHTAGSSEKHAAFAKNFPRQGVAYVVAKGDTLALIAKKSGAKVQDIINANELADPSHIRAGQKLFLPGGRIP